MAKKVRTARITKKIATTVLKVVDAGLSQGLGSRVVGSMCVEAAVCYAMGYPHGDQPKCVTPDLIDLKIEINDNPVWRKLTACHEGNEPETKALRGKALRRLAIAQLGTKGVVSSEQWRAAFAAYLVKKCPVFKKWQAQRAEVIAQTEADFKEFIEKAKRGDSAYFKSVDFDESEYTLNERFIGLLDKCTTKAQAMKLCEDLVQILIKLGAPGTKYLYLTEKGYDHTKAKKGWRGRPTAERKRKAKKTKRK